MENNQQSNRLISIDIFRGITMLLMLFVNDSAGMQGIPDWLRHAHGDEDMMGFSDTVFPAFLFCVGMSVVVSMKQHLEIGKDWRSLIIHVFWRTLSLVVMGLFTLNVKDVAGLSYDGFMLLMVIGFFLTWNVCPKPLWCNLFKAIGIILLTGMIILCDINGKSFHTGWWGILGLIGWTYMVCALVFFVTKGRLKGILLVWGITNIFALLGQTNLIPDIYFFRDILLPFIPCDWTQHLLGVSGMLTASLLLHYKEQPRSFYITMIVLSITFLLFGFAAHPYWIISKIQCTPTWVYFCLCMYFPLMALFQFIVRMGKEKWLCFLKPAATAALTCYILEYLQASVMGLLDISFPEIFSYGYLGLLRSLCVSLIIIWIVGQMKHYKLTLKL